jgi:cyanophycinase
VPGLVALVGAGEFTPALAALDRLLLESTHRRRPRVVVIPTASQPDGPATFERWAAMGRAHFEALGPEVEAALIRDRADADAPEHAQAIGEADLIYLSGGKPAYLSGALRGTAVGRAISMAHERGAVVTGCSAGAMILAGRHWGTARRRMFWPLRWHDGLGLFAGASVVPHYDAFPEAFAALLVLQAPRGAAVLGIDEETAIVGRDGSWQVHGRSRVTVWRGRRRRERFRAGDVFRL